jgi:hypothetical protein
MLRPLWGRRDERFNFIPKGQSQRNKDRIFYSMPTVLWTPCGESDIMLPPEI